MATALAPDIRDWPSAAAVSGSALPPSGTLPASVRAIFPTAALQALEGLWLEIESHTLTPLLLSAPEAIWSQAYARQVYELSVRHGLLRPPSRPPGQSPVVSTDGDLDLADAGLEDLIQFLKQD